MYTAAVICFCVGIAIIDLKTFRIPDVLLAAFMLVMVIIEGNGLIMTVMTRIITTLLVFFLFGAVWRYTQGMGLGDVKYAGVLGYILDTGLLIPAFMYTALLSMVIYLMGIALFHWPKTTKIPFAPFLSAGVILALTGVMP